MASTNASTVDAKKKAAAGKKKSKTSAKKTKVIISPFGSFGKEISFTVSDKKILTFKELQREGSARWKKHEYVGRKPRMQFLGPDADTISLTITLDARHGVKPRRTIEKINAYRDTGKADYLIVKGKKVAKNKLVITKTSDVWDEVWNRGELVRATMEITLQEYT